MPDDVKKCITFALLPMQHKNHTVSTCDKISLKPILCEAALVTPPRLLFRCRRARHGQESAYGFAQDNDNLRPINVLGADAAPKGGKSPCHRTLPPRSLGGKAMGHTNNTTPKLHAQLSEEAEIRVAYEPIVGPKVVLFVCRARRHWSLARGSTPRLRRSLPG